MIRILKTPTEMMDKIHQWYHQNQHFEFLGWEDEDTFKSLMAEQYTIDWQEGLAKLPAHNYRKQPQQALLNYWGIKNKSIQAYYNAYHFYTQAGQRRDNKQRRALQKQWHTEWFPGVFRLEQQIKHIQAVGDAVWQLFEQKHRYRSDKLQAWYELGGDVDDIQESV